MNPQKPILIITMLLLALGYTIYAVIGYLYNQGKIAPILSGALFVNCISILKGKKIIPKAKFCCIF